MIYQSFLPSLPLSEYVRNYTIIHFQFEGTGTTLIKNRSPKPEQKIVFYVKDSPKIGNPATGSIQTPPPVCIFSHQSDKRTIQMTSEFFAFVIFLQPGVLNSLIQMPMMELLNECCDAELFFGTTVRAVSEQLAGAGSQSQMVSIVEQFLFPKCKPLEMKTSIDKIALHLLADPTSFSLDYIAKQACLSTKQFYRRFTERIGISPKFFSRLSRFNHAYRYRILHPSVSWSSISQEFCYTDYHHMEKEFKEFTSLTPQEWTKTHLASPEIILRLR